MSSTNGSVRRNGVTSSAGSALQIKNRNTKEFLFHQLTIERGVGATGSIPVSVLPKGSTVPEMLTDENNAQMTIDVTSPETISFEGLIDAVVLDVTGVSGTINVVLESL